MSDGANPDSSALDAEAKRKADMVRRLVLMKETGPKSAAWHRARVRTIWRLQRELEHKRPAGPVGDREP